MITQPLMFACVLSSGSTWSQPSILPAVGDSWPTGGSASAYAVFTDTTGAVLATINGAISAGAVDFQGIAHTLVDPIPAGANCEVFVTDTDGKPYKIRYGRVVRREAQFPNAFNTMAALNALAYSDTFQRSALGNYWMPTAGTTQIFDNTTSGAVAADTAGLAGVVNSGTPSSLEWQQYASGAIDKIVLAWVAVTPVTATSYSGVTRTLTFTPPGGSSGVQMTSLGAIDSGGGTTGWVELFYLMNPPTAIFTPSALLFQCSVPCKTIIADSMVYNGAAGITPGSFVSAIGSGSASTLTETIASAIHKYVAAGFVCSQGFLSLTSAASGAALRELANITTTGNAGSLGIADAPGSASIGFTASSIVAGKFGVVGVSIDPAPPLAYGVSSVNSLLSASASAMRYFTPLNTDNVSVNVNLLNNGVGKTVIVLCSDVAMTSWLGVEFSEPDNHINFVVGSGPTTYQAVGSPISNSVSNNDNYTINYVDNTNTLAIYKNSVLTPIGTWVDTSSLVPHGPGYRYVGFVFNNPADSNGLQVSGWAAQDQV